MLSYDADITSELNRTRPRVISLLAAATMAASVVSGCAQQTSQEIMRDQAMAQAEDSAKRLGVSVKSTLQTALDAAQDVAQVYQALKAANTTNRDTLNNVLREVLERNPTFIGAWSAWEPDALDGKDSQYVNAPGHDETGRFIPYWNRGSGKIALEALVDYTVPGAGDWYLLPRDTGREMIMEPFIYNVAGKDIFLTTLAVPIVVDNKVVGVSGVDISLDSIRETLIAAGAEDKTYMFLVSNTGIVAAHPDRGIEGKTLTQLGYGEAITVSIQHGETIQAPGDPIGAGAGSEARFVPMQLDRTDTPWSVAIAVP